MKHLILAAGLVSLIAAPAFAGSAHDLNAPQSVNKSESKAVTFTDTQVGGYERDSDSAIAQRNATLRRAAQDRSPNARAAWRGSAHYY